MAKGRRRRGVPEPEFRELDLAALRMSLPHTEFKKGVEYQVQNTTGAKAEEGKTWVCPVCVVTIEPGVNHTVAWDLHKGVQTRRHFHNHCWKLFDGVLF